jgi:hypothetical protein
MESIRLLIGWDAREAVGSHVFLQSVVDRCSLPIEATILTPKLLGKLGVGTDGTNAFSKARFLAPWLSKFCGHTIFVDGADMLVLGDLAELWEERSYDCAVQVVKHNYLPRNKRKYIGTTLETGNEIYPRKNWSSVIIWHNSYFGHRHLTPEYIDAAPGSELHRFGWVPEERLGSLPGEWNVLIDEDGQAEKAKIAHFTNGIPGFLHYADVSYSDEWKQAWQDMNKGMQHTVSFHADK